MVYCDVLELFKLVQKLSRNPLRVLFLTPCRKLSHSFRSFSDGNDPQSRRFFVDLDTIRQVYSVTGALISVSARLNPVIHQICQIPPKMPLVHTATFFDLADDRVNFPALQTSLHLKLLKARPHLQKLPRFFHHIN